MDHRGHRPGHPPLSGRRALIIGGAGEGIGRALTRAFVAAGASVAIADIDETSAAEAAARLGDAATVLPVDVRSFEQVDALPAAAAAALGGLDVLTTVVGGQVRFVPAVRLHEMADDDWETVYDLNLRYVARAVRAALRVFLEQTGGGSIVAIGSVTGFMAAPQQAAYGAAKAGLLSLAKTVAAEYARDAIRMNVVAGGAIATAVNPDDHGDDWVEEIPLGRYGSVDDVVAAAVYLASDAAGYVTGQRIVVDGGVSARGPFG